MNTPTQIIGNCALYLGDCHEIMPQLGKVDAVVTDPPYEFDASGGGAFRAMRKAMNEIQRTGLDKGFDHQFLTPDLAQSCVVFCHNDQVAKLMSWLNQYYFRVVILGWFKLNPVPMANNHYKPDTELYLHAWNKGAHPLGALAHKGRYWSGRCGRSGIDHPTSKPVGLMEKIVINTNGETILDPFMGSGSTGVACIRQGRGFIGIERESKYFDIACQRLEDELNAPDMFVTPHEIQTQGALI